MVMLIAQDITDLGGQVGEQPRRDRTVGDIGEGELSRQGNPEAADGHRQMQLPAIPPPIPTRLAPVRFGITGGMGHDACRPIFLVPHAAVRAYGRAITSDPVPLLCPGIEDRPQGGDRAGQSSRATSRATWPSGVPRCDGSAPARARSAGGAVARPRGRPVRERPATPRPCTSAQ
jgi:hypothetical protein